ncbi:MAG TPA: CRISPR-associated endonuclease Cas1, partial [Chromatiaceae bacterium]|nr:CRISPR-associated endonuclease Cas1 [Chromatiaceae bacterium]
MDEPRQAELPLPFPEFSGDQPLLPARMLNEYQYCPRLAYLEWVQDEWADSGDTVEGRHLHKRVDHASRGGLPDAEALEDEQSLRLRSITLSSNRLGLIARMDLLEVNQGRATPVDYKHGKRPHVARGAYDPERVQLCAQGLLLREHGYSCDHGILYYAASRERVKVPFDDELLALTRQTMEGLRAMAAGGRIPPPLEDSPKCPRCSLVAICLPDETRSLEGDDLTPRPLFVAREEALPLYVQDNRARIRKKGDQLEVFVEGDKVATARIREISQLVIQGNAHITTAALRHLMDQQIPITWMSYGGWFNGHSMGTGHKNVEIRTAQYRASFDPARCRRLARGLVHAKILNSRTLLRRSWRGDEKPRRLLEDLKRHARRAEKADDLEQLLGIEGAAAALYFGHFQQLIRQPGDPHTFTFDFT